MPFIKTSDKVLIASRWRCVYTHNRVKYVWMNGEFKPLSSLRQRGGADDSQPACDGIDLYKSLIPDVQNKIREMYFENVADPRARSLNKCTYTRFIEQLPVVIKKEHGTTVIDTPSVFRPTNAPELRTLCNHANIFVDVIHGNDFWEEEDTILDHDDAMIAGFYKRFAYHATWTAMQLHHMLKSHATVDSHLQRYFSKGRSCAGQYGELAEFEQALTIMSTQSPNTNRKNASNAITISQLVDFYMAIPKKTKLCIGL
jgi:hypothetical protein